MFTLHRIADRFARTHHTKADVAKAVSVAIADGILPPRSKTPNTETVLGLIDAQKEVRVRRAANRARPVQTFRDRTIAETERAVLEAVDGLYRVARSRWAGGDHSTRVKIGNPSARGESYREWSRNGKWSGNSSTHTITVPIHWLATVRARGLAVVDGMLTLAAKPVRGHGPELFEAAWVEQGRGFDLNVARGYIARIGGTTYHAPSARAALDGVSRKAGQKPPRRKGTLDLDRLARRLGDLPVTVEDSDAVGNCTSGTRSWCRAVGIEGRLATLAEVIRGYKLRPLPEVLRVIHRVVRTQSQRRPITEKPSALERPGRVVFDSEGGFHVEPSDN